jgi:uncharacterized protein YdaU (DUF1376 family)
MSSGTGKSLAMLPFWPRDYIAATRHLSLAERGAYTDLLFLSWEMGSLPKDPARLARLVGSGADEFAQVWPTIRAKFTETDDGLVNARLEEHRTESIRRSDKARESALASWSSPKRSRSRHRPDANADAVAHATADANADATAYANGHAKSMLPSPSPSPSPGSGVLSENSRPQSRTVPASFHQEVIAAYHELLPSLPRVKLWTEKRRRALDARIRERRKDGKPADTIAYWRSLFEQVAASDFLCGRSTDFRADLEWILRPENFAKCIEGRYTGNRSSNGARAHG